MDGSQPGAAVANVFCTLLDVANGPDRTNVTGLVGAGSPEDAAKAALAAAGVRAPRLNWAPTRFEGPYCSVMDTLRGIRTAAPGASFQLGTRGNKTRFRFKEIMAPVVTAPSFPSFAQLAYFQSDQTVTHLVQQPDGADKPLAPGSPVPIAGAQSGGWEVGDPAGGDLLVAIMTSVPLPPRPLSEPTDAYLPALQRAADEIVRGGGTVVVRALPITTVAR